MDLLVTSEEASYLESLGFKVETMQSGEEINSLIEEQTTHNIQQRGPGGYEWGQYNNLSMVYAFFDHLLEMHPENCQVDVLGQTSLGEDIEMITISQDLNDTTSPIIILDSALHGLEWSATYVAMSVMHSIIHGIQMGTVNTTTTIRYVVIPVVNVDGYKYSWESVDRFWRKSRTDIGDDVCVGIDPNRNFEVNFGGDGASDLPCSDEYSGAAAYDEDVSELLRSYMEDNISYIQAYVSLHSYGQTIMYPMSSSEDDVTNKETLESVANLAADASFAVNGTTYQVGSVTDFYDMKSGTSYDYAQMQGVPYVYTIEVRDSGEYGYLLPEDQLDANAAEVSAAFQVIVASAIEAYNNSP